jgi:hypothetical protein
LPLSATSQRKTTNVTIYGWRTRWPVFSDVL